MYSQPYQTADGATIIAVSKVRGKVRVAGENVGVRGKPLGVFVIRGADVKWEPAVAMIRRPPWPDLRGTIG